MNGKRRRELTAALEASRQSDRVCMRALSDALRGSGLTVVRAGTLADALESLSDLYTLHTTGRAPACGRDAFMAQVRQMLNREAA